MINTLPRHGHAHGHIRNVFIEAIESEDPALVYFAAGQLWSCTDTLAGADCQLLDIPRGSSYAQGARSIRAGMQKPSVDSMAEAAERWSQLLDG